MPTQPLAVPMQLDALMVNQSVMARDSFRWWQFNYMSLSHFRSPEPMALDRSVGGQQQGVYLSWTLPDALRHSGADSGAGEYPLVPNRWLIVRMNGTTQRQATAWVLESDCPFTTAVTTSTSGNASMYLAEPSLVAQWQASPDPIRRAVVLDAKVPTAKLGVSFPLAGWTERAPTGMFLSAVAPSNPLFSTFVAHNLGVFSFYDDLKGIDSDTISYSVVGWYSDPTQDILASAGTDAAYAALLGELGWTLAGGSTSATATTLCHGSVFQLAWSRTGSAPATDPLQGIRDTGKLNVGVGNTTIDAFTTLIEQQLKDPVKARLLRAFQYDFLQQLNQVNGDALLDEQIRQAWFGSKAGGYSWNIVLDKSDGSTGTPLTADEQAWLLALNQAQAALDAALTTLYSLQWELHGLWLKQGYLADGANTFPEPPDGVGSLTQFKAQLASELDPTKAGSTAARLVAQFGVVQALLPQVPQPVWTNTTNAQQALQNGILAFASGKKLDATKTLKTVAAPRFWHANNPVVIVSGVEGPPPAVSNEKLPVRPSGALVTGFTSAGSPVTAAAVSGLMGQLQNLPAVPAGAGPLLQEFMLLDPGNAGVIATATGQAQSAVAAVMAAHDPAAYQGTLPARGLAPWQQPWSPMFLEWAGTYSYIPFTSSAGAPAWTFDGTDYRLTAAPSTLALEKRAVGGISLLSPHASFVFGSRLDQFVQQYGSATELAQIDEWIASVYGWQFLAQELTGFHDLLSLRDTRAFRRPSTNDVVGGLPVAALTGYGDGAIPAALVLPPASLGQVNSVPFLPNGPALPFHGSRGGAFYFTDFYLYDRFGRTLFVIQSGQSSGLFDFKNFPVQIDAALAPDEPVVPNVASVLQLPPRLLQHARLDVRLLDAQDDAKVYGTAAGVMPISGWVLPNHLDGSILVFAPDGTAMGEFRLYAQADGSKLGQWTPPPHSTLTLDGVGAAAPHLRSLLDSPQLKQPAGFQAFLASIDETLWTTDPLGDRADANLSVLVGRPLALLRTRLQLQVEGDAITDTGWAATFADTAPDFLGFQFDIRLGDQLTREDGVIGYFTGTDYDVFNSTVAPPATPAQTYVTEIGPVGAPAAGNYLQLSFAPDTYQYVTVLADPRAAVHAYTGILPVKQLDIPQQYVDAALSAMEISFQLGPVLTVMGPTPGTGGAAPPFAQSIVFPAPAEQNGSWSWWEKDAATGEWTGSGLVAATPDARDPEAPSTLRDGYLQFITNLNQ
ncbi:MAG TPA: hypothetical protein VGB66_14435 [Longimicrobium sp.]